ncbi:hypothetical protein COCON_G00126780 [Conger conger]|uniref:Bcl-2 Bcl-2 homology region 1-3 domain-containing protein n=1 Tax=Conger conger TaxID=82655 RepID=A0A9Q1HWR4_CONCO|nr:hypothetical protein COCON_G00126780 [Conger conger]
MNRNMLTMNRTTTSIVSSLTPYCQNGGLENGSWNGKEGWTVKLADELDNYSDEVDNTRRRMVSDVITKHQIAYNGMIQRLCLDERDDDMSFVATVAENLFSDGSTNWGRIVSLVAFGATVCQHLKEAGREGCVDQVGVQISSYLLNHKKDWLLSNNGWDGFVEVFHVEDPESVVRNALMAFAGVAGLGAGLAYLIR